MKRTLSLLLTTFLVYVYVYPTSQMPDILIYNGNKYCLDNFYLESYFEKNPDKKVNIETTSTALWRGYIATFEIDNNQLFLINLEVEANDDNHKLAMKSIFNEVFPDSKRVKLDYFNGILWGGIYEKKKTYSSDYDNYCIFEIKDGNIVKEKSLKTGDYKKFKKQQITAFEQTDGYKVCIQELKSNHLKMNGDLEQFSQGLGDKEMTEYYSKLKSTELSDKKAREIIHYNIFNFIPKFIE